MELKGPELIKKINELAEIRDMAVNITYELDLYIAKLKELRL